MPKKSFPEPVEGTVVGYRAVRQAHRAGKLLCKESFPEPVEGNSCLLFVGSTSSPSGDDEWGVTMKGYMYILKCANGSYYTGSTSDLEMRVEEHKNGLGANFTRKHLPVELVYVEEFSRIEDAFCREKQIQGWSRKKKEALIAGNFDKLKEFAKAGSTGSPSV